MFNKLRDVVKQREQLAKEKHENDSKNRLFQIIKKKLETTFIGDIAAIEEAFGELWGIDYADNELTEEERKFKIIWDKLRTNILDRGNAQIRGIKSELEQYTIIWDGYNYQFNIKDSK